MAACKHPPAKCADPVCRAGGRCLYRADLLEAARNAQKVIANLLERHRETLVGEAHVAINCELRDAIKEAEEAAAHGRGTLGAALMQLAVALAPLMPSAAAAPHAALEWRRAREAWVAALQTLEITEGQAAVAARERERRP